MEITENCNLNCPMCPRGLRKNQGRNLPIKNFKHLLKEIPSLKHIKIMSWGEPFLHPDIFEILDLGAKKGITFTITTNGTILNEEKIRKINKNVIVMEFSIDSPSVEGYRKIRGADLNVVLANAKKVKELRPDIYLRLQGVIMEGNIEELPDFIPMAKKVGADEMRLFSLVAFTKDIDTWQCDKKKMERMMEKLKEAEDLAKKEGVKLVATPSFTGPKTCTEPWLQPRIALNGNVYSCCLTYNSSEPTWKEWFHGTCVEMPQHKYMMGNLYKESFKKIWNSPAYKLLRKTVREADCKRLATTEEIIEQRKNFDSKKGRFPYCEICLLNQNRIC